MNQSLCGCLKWTEEIESPEFIYYCPFCSSAGIGLSPVCAHSYPTNLAIYLNAYPQLRLLSLNTRQDKQSILFRYDPPVLIVAATWHEKQVEYARALYWGIQQAYCGHEDYVCGNPAQQPHYTTKQHTQVMLASVRLDGSYHEPGKTKGPLPNPDVTEFLEQYPTAKIIVVVDTHCLQETGGLLWYGNNTDTYQACTLYGVSKLAPIHHFHSYVFV